MPDLDILIEMSDYYEVDLRELLNGERKSEKMDKDLEETVMKVAEYSNNEKEIITRRMHILFIGGLIASILYTVMYFSGIEDNFWGGLCQGITFGMMIVGVIMTSKYASQFRSAKTKCLDKIKK